MQNDDFFTIHSGDTLNIDDEKGLNGDGWPAPADRLPCGLIIAKDTGSFTVNNPILQLVEGEKQDIEIGVPQCAAQVVGA